MMRKIIEKEIQIILNQLFTLKDEQKDLLINKIKSISDTKLLKAESLLLKLHKEQTRMLAEHLTKNPNFIKKLSSLKTAIKTILKKEKNAKVEEDTNRKIIAVLEKINTL